MEGGVSWLERIVAAEESRMLDSAKTQARLKVDIQRSKRLHADLKAKELLLLEEISLLGESIATRQDERKRSANHFPASDGNQAFSPLLLARLAGQAAPAAAATTSASSEASKKKRPRITPLPGEAGQADEQAREGEGAAAGWTAGGELREAETLLEELEAKKKRRAMGLGQSDVVVYDTESEANDDDDDDVEEGKEMSAAELEDVLLRMMNEDEAEEENRRELLDAEHGDANCTIVEAVLVRRSSAADGKPAKPTASGIRFRADAQGIVAKAVRMGHETRGWTPASAKVFFQAIVQQVEPIKGPIVYQSPKGGIKVAAPFRAGGLGGSVYCVRVKDLCAGRYVIRIADGVKLMRRRGGGEGGEKTRWSKASLPITVNVGADGLITSQLREGQGVEEEAEGSWGGWTTTTATVTFVDNGRCEGEGGGEGEGEGGGGAGGGGEGRDGGGGGRDVAAKDGEGADAEKGSLTGAKAGAEAAGGKKRQRIPIAARLGFSAVQSSLQQSDDPGGNDVDNREREKARDRVGVEEGAAARRSEEERGRDRRERTREGDKEEEREEKEKEEFVEDFMEEGEILDIPPPPPPPMRSMRGEGGGKSKMCNIDQALTFIKLCCSGTGFMYAGHLSAYYKIHPYLKRCVFSQRGVRNLIDEHGGPTLIYEGEKDHGRGGQPRHVIRIKGWPFGALDEYTEGGGAGAWEREASGAKQVQTRERAKGDAEALVTARPGDWNLFTGKNGSPKYENGYVFAGNQVTFPECLEKSLFGSGGGMYKIQREVRVGTTALFLYNTTTNQLHGLFEASAPPDINIDPDAFQQIHQVNVTRSRKGNRSSPFPAQVSVNRVVELAPIGTRTYDRVMYRDTNAKAGKNAKIGKRHGIVLEQDEVVNLISAMGGF